MKAAADRTIAELRADGLRRMAAAVPTVVDAVEKVANDDNAPARDRIRAFEAVARAVYPAAGPDHVARQAYANAAGQQDREIRDLLRVPREEVEQQIVASLVDDGGFDPEQAARLVELWYLAAGGTLGRDPVADLAAVMEDAWRTAVGVADDDDDAAADVVPLQAIEATATEEFSASSNGYDDAARQLLDELARAGVSPADALDMLRADDEDDDGD